MMRLSALIVLAGLIGGSLATPSLAATLPGASTVRETVQKSTENQIRRLVEPLLDKYCHDQCKLLSVAVQVDLNVPETIAPGFDEPPPVGPDSLAPTSAKMKILMADKIGAVSRGKLLELIQRYLDTLDYPVTVDMDVVHFPDPAGSEGKVAELRDRIAKNFENTVNTLIQQFCPEQCLFTDFNLKTEAVNAEEAQYAAPGEFVQEGDIAIKIKEIGGTLLIDESLSPEERTNIVEMIKLKTSSFKHVALNSKTLRFPKPSSMNSAVPGYGTLDNEGEFTGAKRGLSSEKLNREQMENKSSDSRSVESRQHNENANNSSSNELNSTAATNASNTSNSNDTKKERFEHYEKIERVENGDAVHAELQNFKVYALIFGCSILSLLIFIAIASMRQRHALVTHTPSQTAASSLSNKSAASDEMGSSSEGSSDTSTTLSRRLEIQRLTDDLVQVFSQHPRVAKHVFTRVITEDGIEITALYLHIFGESIVIDMLRDPSLQGDMNELMEYYARTTIDLKDVERLDLLRKLHQRTVSGKLAVIGNRSSNLFDFLAEMDAMQILEMIRNESITVKAIILTQCDAQKRSMIYGHLDEEIRMKLLAELSRIDYLPRDFIFNVANALKRKRRENPRLNTEALPGSEVLVSLLERTGTGLQRDVMKNLESSSPDSARNVKGKLVSVETLRYLRDGQLLEVVLSLRHDELIQFLKAAPPAVRDAIFAKSPRELAIELEDEVANAPQVNRETYFAIERKILNRMKLMANDGLINLVETNERMFADQHGDMTTNIQAGGVVGSITPDGVSRREAG
ncbi:MAG: FliG C-terminal domain-containing protein [Bdellovibrionia bacterium]